MSESAINIVLNAIDNYSGAITGLNQGLELLGKGFGFVKDAAGFAFNTINSGIELAKVGGAFQEQRSQFENLAASYKQNGQSIIDTVRETASYTVNEMDSIKVATKAMAAGLQGDNMKTALSYMKKWSEATGESFLSVSDRAFTALSSGKTALLNQMGLFIDKGDDLNAIVGKMSDGLKRFGTTGFNASDQFEALSASQDDFWRKVGQGVNNSEGFQKILTTLTDAVVGFVRGFNPAPVTLLFDLITDGAIDVYKTFADAFPAASKLLESLFTNPVQGAKELSRASVDVFYGIYKAAAEAVNGILETFKSINSNNLLGDLAAGVLKFFAYSGSTFVNVVEKSVSFAADIVAKALSGFGQFLANSPRIADFLGIDPDAFNFKQSAEDLKQSVRTVTGAFKLGFDDLFVKSGDLFGGLNNKFEGLKTNLSDIDKAHKTALTSLKALEDSYDTSAIKATGFDTNALQEKIEKLEAKEAARAQKAEARAQKASEAALKRADKEAEAAEKSADRAVKAADKAADAIQKKFTGFGIALSPDALDALAKSIPTAKAKVELDTTDLDKVVKGKIETDVNLKLDDKRTDDKLPPDSAILQWILQVVKNGLVAGAVGEGLPLAVTT